MTAKSLSARLDTKVQIQSPPDPDDPSIQSDTGEVDLSEENWTVVATGVWAELVADAGSEITIGDQLVGLQRWRVTMRRRSDLKGSYRLKVLTGELAGKFLAIESFAPAQRGEESTLICRQAVPG